MRISDAALRILVLGCLLAGCTSRTASVPGSVTVALDTPPINLDPRISTDATSVWLDELLFNSLVKRTKESDVQPDLALSWETPDPKTYIFHLRHNVTFHDGRPLTSKDVVFTFRSILDGSVQTAKLGTYRVIDSVEALDSYTVVFKLKEVFAPFLWNLNEGIVPEGAPADFSQHPIGSGPFEYVHYLPDAEVVLKRNDAYYGMKPHIPLVRFKLIPEAVVAALELRKGSVDIGLRVLPPDVVEVLKKDPDLRVLQAPGTDYQYLAFNLADPVFQDIRVRQAIAYAIDREKIIKYLWRNQARAASGVIPPNNWAYESNVQTYPYDPKRAKELLREAGQEHLTFTYRTSTDETARLLAAVIQQELKQIGVTIKIRSNEFATFYSDVTKGNFQMYSLRWIGGNTNPDFLDLIFSSNKIPPNGANRGHYSNSRVDELIAAGRHELDMGKRRQAYQEIQRIVAEELPYISLFYLDDVCVYNKRIEGLKLFPGGGFGFLGTIQTQFD